MCVRNWEPSWAAAYDVICPRVSRPLLLSRRKVDRLGSPGSGYGSQNGSSDWCHLNSIIISARETSEGSRRLQPLTYAQISGLISKLNSVWPERSVVADELMKSREGANGLMAVICIVIAKSLIVRGLSIIKNSQMGHMPLFLLRKR